MNVGVWIPYFPLYLASRGLDGAQVGLLLALNPAIRWSGAVVWAYAADRYRVRHRLLVAASVASTLCLVALLLVDHIAGLAAAIAAIAFLSAPLIPLTDASVVDHLERLGGDYGRLRAWGSIGFIAGSFGAAAILAWTTPAVVPWLLIAAQAGFPFVAGRLPREQLGHPEQFRAPWRLVNPPLAAFLLASFLMQVSSGAWAGFFAAYTRSLGLSESVPGVAWGLAVASEVAVLYFGRRLLIWLRAPDLLLLVLVTTAARYLLTALARTEVPLVALQLAYGLGFAGFHLSAQVLLAQLVPPRSSTNGQALYGFISFGLGGSIGLALAGALVDRIGPAGLFAFEAAIAAAALVPTLWLRSLMRPARTK